MLVIHFYAFMKNTILIIVLLFGIYPSFSQVNDSISTVSGHSIQVAPIGIRYNYEQAFGQKFSLNYTASLEYSVFPVFVFDLWHANICFDFEYSLNPVLQIEPRYYFNLNKRAAKGKNTYLNSGGFLALSCTFFLPPLSYNTDKPLSGFFITPYWGVKRVWYKHFLFEFGAGLNFFKFFSWKQVGIFPYLNYKLGYQF